MQLKAGRGAELFLAAMLAGVGLAAAPPCEYTLRLSFRDPGTGTVTPTETRLTVR